MNKIPFAVGQAAAIAVMQPNADATYSNAAGGLSVFAGILPAKRGKPLSVLQLTKDNFLSVLGDAISPHDGIAFEPIRHVRQALNGGNGYVVRVCPKSMRIPVLKLQQPASSASQVIDFNRSVFNTDLNAQAADGYSRIVLQFTPKDSKGNVITGLDKSVIGFAVSPAADAQISAVTESNGVYTAYLTSTVSGTLSISVTQSGMPMPTFSRSVVMKPAHVDTVRSTISVSPGAITANNSETAIVTLMARDASNAAITDVDNIDFVVTGNQAVSIITKKPSTDGKGNYSIQVKASAPGDATIQARQDGSNIAGMAAALQVKAVSSSVTPVIDPANSNIMVSPGQIEANNNDQATITFTAVDNAGAPLAGLTGLSFVVSGVAGYNVSAITDKGDGSYTASIYSSGDGAAIIKAQLNGKDIGSKTASLSIVKTAAPVINANQSSLTRSPATIAADGKAASVITFLAVDTTGAKMTGLASRLAFNVNASGATIDQIVENAGSPGSYSANLTATKTGSFAVSVSLDNVLVGVQSVSVTVAPVNINGVDAAKSVLNANISAGIAGDDTATLTFEAKTASGNAVTGLTDVTFHLSNYPGEQALRATEDTPGTYTADLPLAGVGDIAVTVSANGALVQGKALNITVKPGADEGSSDFTLSKAAGTAGSDTTDLAFTAKDTNGDAVTGLSVTVDITTASGKATIKMPEDGTTGVYKLHYVMVEAGSVAFAINVGGKALAAAKYSKTITVANPVQLIDPAKYKVSVSPASAVADGSAVVTVTLEPIAAADKVEGLTNLTLGHTESTVMTQYVTANKFVEDAATKGTYTATVTSTLQGAVQLVAQEAGANLTGLKTSATFTANADNVDKSKSSLVLSKKSIIADGNDTTNVNYTANDKEGQPIIGLTNVTAVVSGVTGITVNPTTLSNGGNGVYTTTIKGNKDGSATVDIKVGTQDGIATPQTLTLAVVAAVADVSGAGGSFSVSSNTAVADGSTSVVATLVLVDTKGQPFTGAAGDLTLDAGNVSGVTADSFTETSTLGTYTANVKASTAVASLMLKANYKGTLIPGFTKTVTFTAAPRVDFDAADTTIAVHGGTGTANNEVTLCYGSTTTDIVLDLHFVKDGNPVTGISNVTLTSSDPSVQCGAITAAVPASAGDYTATLKVSKKGTFTVTLVDDGADTTATLTVKVLASKASSINIGNSSFTASASSLAAGGTDTVSLTFTAKDDATPTPGAVSGLLPDLTFAPKAANAKVHIGTISEGADSNGVYTATVTGDTGFATTEIVVKWKGAQIGTFSSVITEKAVTTPTTQSIDPEESVFTAVPATFTDDGSDSITLTFTAKDNTTAHANMSGLNVVFEAAATTTGLTIGSATEVGTSGVYQAEVTSTAQFTDLQIDVYIGGSKASGGVKVAIPTAKAVKVTCTDHTSPVTASRMVTQINGPYSAASVASTSAVTYAAPVAASQAITIASTTISVGQDVVLGENDLMAIYVDDGDASTDRQITLLPQDDGLWLLTLEQIVTGGKKVLESIEFSLSTSAIDDMGLPAYLPTKLENSDSRLRAVVAKDAEFPLGFTGIADPALFVGGSDGDLDSLTPDDYAQALSVLSASMVNYTAVLGLGCYDDIVLHSLAQHASDVRVDMFCDIRPGLSGTQAITAAAAQNFGGYANVARYHFPYSSKDPISGAQMVYGLSGDVFTAKAKGVALNNDVGGWHYNPAGPARATLDRANIKPLPGAASIDREAYVTARINPVAVGSDGSVVIDDELTTWSKNNYLRFQHVNSTLNAIARAAYDICQTLKHEPDGITRNGLTKELTRLLERYVASAALVTPRDATQGTSPFVVEVTQAEFDLWNIRLFVCPTGVARRMSVEPILFR